MKILQIIFKNSSTLDFTLPIFWKLRTSVSTSEITIFYWSLSKKEKIFFSPFSESLMNELNIKEVTLSNFPKKGCGLIVNFVKKILEIVPQPATPFKEAVRGCHIPALIDYFCFRLVNVLKKFTEKNLIDYEQLLKSLDYDQLFFDNRSRIENVDLLKLKSWLDEKKRPVILTPHAPHYIRETEGFAPLIPGKVELTDYCQVWYTHLNSRPWVGFEKFKNIFFQSGYPGFDQEWLQFLKERSDIKKDPQVMNVLFLGRKFFHKGIKKLNADEFVTLTYEETLDFLKSAYASFKKEADKHGVKLHIIYKPHPSSQLSLVERVLRESGIKSFEIYTDLLYFALPRVDIIFSPYTTSLLIGCSYKLPVLLVNSPLQEQINSYWDKVDRMYRGLEFFCESEKELPAKISQSFTRVASREENISDSVFLLQFFPQDSLQKCLQHLLKSERN